MSTADETANVVEESIPEPSKLSKVGTAAATVGIFVIPVVLSGASAVFGWKISKMNYETAVLNLEAAKAAVQK
jgi:hypothetical protein